MTKDCPKWITCQIGAREHYAIPRALAQVGELYTLLTDAWVPPQSPLHSIPHPSLTPLQERFHPQLADLSVRHYTAQFLAFEIQHRFRRTPLWPRTMARNAWFQRQACSTLQTLSPSLKGCDLIFFFTYSYAALDLLRFAKDQGWYTILGQIDPGLREAEIVRQAHQRHPHLAPHQPEPPPQYWEQWQAECQLADQILVNSSWSQQALTSIGIPPAKLKVVPLAYEATTPTPSCHRTYPDRFTPDRPLRVLFLGQVILRKGIAALIEAARALGDQPIEFWVVGPLGIDPPQLPNIQWLGPVPRSQVPDYYQAADVFLFPTLSDGFGLTQLEAQAWHLPIIASQYCGEVIQDHINGILLPEVSPDAIITALHQCLKSPQQLSAFAQASTAQHSQFSLESLYYNLQALSHATL